MPAREIDRGEWGPFLDRFSQQHEGWAVKIEIRGADGPQVEAEDLPLLGISIDSKRSPSSAIEIMAGTEPEDHITHVVPEPVRVRTIETEIGAHAGLEIESARAGTTLLLFLQPARLTPANIL